MKKKGKKSPLTRKDSAHEESMEVCKGGNDHKVDGLLIMYMIGMVTIAIVMVMMTAMTMVMMMTMMMSRGPVQRDQQSQGR